MNFKKLQLLLALFGWMFLIGCGSAEAPISSESGSAAAQASQATAEAAPEANAAPGKAKNATKQTSKYEAFPKAYNWVNDFAGMISDKAEESMIEKIKAYEEKTSNEIALVTVETIKPAEDIVEYTRGLGNYWGVGKKSIDNGVVILIDKESRQIRIASGLGLKKEMPDDVCQSIIDQQIVPEFKKGNIDAGLKNAIDRIISILPDPKK